MVIIVLLIAVSLSIALIFLGVFFWNIRSGQYDDMFTPSVRMLFDKKLEEGNIPERPESAANDVQESDISRDSHPNS